MDYEKSYKEALDRAQKLKETCDSTAVIGWCEHIFPELKEVENEQIRKWLISQLEIKSDVNNSRELELMILRSIAWLEKQGETNIQNNNPLKIESDKFYFCIKDYFAGGCCRSKKGDIVLVKNGMNMMGLSPKEASEYFMPTNPFNEDVVDWFKKQREETVDIANKIRPKFDIGDWITCPELPSVPPMVHVINIEDGLYELEDVYGTKKRSTIGHVESIYYHWTIKDAKEGDVLYYEDSDSLKIFIYQFGKVHYYCCLTNNVFVSHSYYFSVEKDRLSRIRPANAEQRNFLFARMKEEGYQWDKNRKELIKL